MGTATLLQTLFRHKAWANDQLFAELAKLDVEGHAKERQAAIRLLNHIHVVDRIFAAHLAGEPHGYTATNTRETPGLEALRDAVATTDCWYVEHVGPLDAGQLTATIDFTFTDGDAGRMSREEMLVHVIGHGNYHRGAVGRIMSQLGVPPPRDLLTAYLHRAEPVRRNRV